MNKFTDKQRIALDYLMRSADDLERVANQRIAYMRAAREHGLTNQAIATALRITEAAVRAALKRREDA